MVLKRLPAFTLNGTVRAPTNTCLFATILHTAYALDTLACRRPVVIRCQSLACRPDVNPSDENHAYIFGGLIRPCAIVLLGFVSHWFCVLVPAHRCHLGQSIIYDTVSDLHWSVDIRTHGIVVVIEQILGVDWNEKTGSKKGWGRKAAGLVLEPGTRLTDIAKGLIEDKPEVPTPKPEEDCVECYAWEFGDFMNDTVKGR